MITGQTLIPDVSRCGRARPLARPSGVEPVITGTDVPGLHAPNTDSRGSTPSTGLCAPNPPEGYKGPRPLRGTAQKAPKLPAKTRDKCPRGRPCVVPRECRRSREGLRVSPAFRVQQMCTHAHVLPGSAAFRGQAVLALRGDSSRPGESLPAQRQPPQRWPGCSLRGEGTGGWLAPHAGNPCRKRGPKRAGWWPRSTSRPCVRAPGPGPCELLLVPSQPAESRPSGSGDRGHSPHDTA